MSNFPKLVRFLFDSWFPWVTFVVVGVVWGLPGVPYYQDWLPYGYDLGGPALVALYMALGFLSLGMFGMVTGLMGLEKSREQRHRALLLGGGGVVLAWAFGGLYMILMDISLSLV